MKEILQIANIDSYIVLGILLFFGMIENLAGHYKNTERTRDDWILEVLGFIVVSAVKAFIFFTTLKLGELLLPVWGGYYSGKALTAAFLIYILVDDFLQYCYHRLAHRLNLLWKHHRPHHAAEEMGVLVSYRNSAVYYLIMPNIWWAAICSYLGMNLAVVLGLIIKQLIVTSSHSSWKWDERWYTHRILRPLILLIERIIITPAFHHSHHGRSQQDKISDPNANFGNAFSIWDQLFGTAVFSHKFPVSYGLQTDPKDKWNAHLFYPVIKSEKSNSEISGGFKKQKNIVPGPVELILEKGTYLYCQCGYSENQPFCNGSHHGTQYKPLVFDMHSTRNARLCRCKLSKTPPYCDNSHESINGS